MNKLTKILIPIACLVIIVSGLAFIFGTTPEEVVNDIGANSQGKWQPLSGTATSTYSTMSRLATDTDPIISNVLHLGPDADSITLSIGAKSSTSAPTLDMYFEVSRDNIHWYPWTGGFNPATNTALLTNTSTYPWLLPDYSNVSTATMAFTLNDLNTEFLRVNFSRDDADGNDNMYLYSEAYINKF